MAKKKVQTKKVDVRNYQMRWKSEDERNLEKAITDFNKRVRNLARKRKDTSYLPDEIDFEETKKLIGNRTEFNRIIKSLSRFKGNEATKKVTLPTGKELTAWERHEIAIQKGVAQRRIKKMMEEEKKLYKGRKTERYRELESTLESVKDIFKKKGVAFELAQKRIENYGSQDYEIRRAIIYKENYLSMLQKNFENQDGYEELKKEILKMNPTTFYEKLKNMEKGEKIKDISFMYDENQFDEAWELLFDEFGLYYDEEGNVQVQSR